MNEIKPTEWHYGHMYGYGDSICILRRPASDYGPQGVAGDAPIAIVVEKAPHWQNTYPVEQHAKLLSAAPTMADVLDMLLERATLTSGERAAVYAALIKAGRKAAPEPVRVVTIAGRGM
ncbi:hypothetical protein NUJ28_07145 [Burkholderia multivorans]|uniref:hypothetical protein n=1 Tax=Burkholderia multivorans TaxID=87883 RepID=UPI0021D89D52|nr:hypothetical protein [Burkholderia multivorans]UXZ62307.1 hypothetical protein NUJ28_06210 [Burkholderia multivorans]UXZ62482.1 hypothetical protein NUJ28_07145 [Burkholderia multivorans]